MPINNGLFNGVRYVAFNMTGYSAAQRFLYGITEDNAENSVISVFMCPKALITDSDNWTDGTDVEDVGAFQKNHTVHFNKNDYFDGYKPKNNKLYTHPYIALAVDTLSCCTIYRWEWFENATHYDEVKFEILGAISPNSEFRVSPINYCNGEGSGANYTVSNFITGFPQCAWAIDSYAAWLAQKSTAEYLNMASTAVGVAGALMGGNVLGGIQGGIGLASQYNAMMIEQTRGDMPRGNIGGSVDTGAKIKGVYYKKMSITGEYAKQIDSYFDRFGYCVNEIKQPSRKNRANYTYIKTNGCQIRTLNAKAIPCDAVEKIKSIYDNGVTFWCEHTTPGDYSFALGNQPLGGGGV